MGSIVSTRQGLASTLVSGAGAVALFISIVQAHKYLPGEFESLSKFIAYTAFTSGFALLAFDHYLFRVAKWEGSRVSVPPRSKFFALSCGTLLSVASLFVVGSWTGEPAWGAAALSSVALQGLGLWFSLFERIKVQLVSAQWLSNAWRFAFFAAVLLSVLWSNFSLPLLISLISALSACYLLAILSPVLVWDRESSHRTVITGDLRFWFGIGVGALSFSLLLSLDRMLVERVGGGAALAQYTLAATFILLPSTFASSIASTVLGSIYKASSTTKGPISWLVSHPNSVLFVASLFISLLGLLAFGVFMPKQFETLGPATHATLIAMSIARSLLAAAGAKYSVRAMKKGVILLNFGFLALVLIVSAAAIVMGSIWAALLAVLLLVLLRIAFLNFQLTS